MADPLVSESSGASTYRPLSGFALAGFAVGVIFAGLVAVSVAVALIKGVPLFFPSWLLVLPIGGFILSLLGQRAIANSEGTRAGLSLARAGRWLCLITGLGYLAYAYVTGLALTSQANAFLLGDAGPDTGFFARLEKASGDPVQLRAAFLLTLPSIARKGLTAEDERGMALVLDQPKPDGEPGRFSSFKQTFLVRAFEAAAGAMKVEALGVQDWSYEQRSYKVTRNYRLKAPDLEMDLRITVISVEPEDAGKNRTWFVDLGSIDRTRFVLTPLGKGINDLRGPARLFVERWIDGLNAGAPYPAFNPEQTAWGSLVRQEEPREALRERMTALFKSTAKRRLPFDLTRRHDGIGDWQFTPDKHLRLSNPFRLRLPPDGASPGATLDGRIVAQTRRPIDPAGAHEPPDWEIAEIAFTRAALGEGKR